MKSFQSHLSAEDRRIYARWRAVMTAAAVFVLVTLFVGGAVLHGVEGIHSATLQQGGAAMRTAATLYASALPLV